jgi:3-hydroxybutyryl-CoA dehydrogenase
MKTVGVVGCGLMGSGIAQVSAQAGFTTWVREVDKPALDKGLGRIRKFLEDGVAKGKLTADVKDETLGRIKGTTELQDLATCDLVIEAVSRTSTRSARSSPPSTGSSPLPRSSRATPRP